MVLHMTLTLKLCKHQMEMKHEYTSDRKAKTRRGYVVSSFHLSPTHNTDVYAYSCVLALAQIENEQGRRRRESCGQ